jgi:glutamate-1-semialdehyde 2,1-aminomutase
MNQVLEEEGVKWAVYGTYSGIHIYTNPDEVDITPSTFDALAFIPRMMGKSRGPGITSQVRMGLLVNGVDMNTGPSGTISAMHGEEEMAITVDAFRATIRAMRREGTMQ